VVLNDYRSTADRFLLPLAKKFVRWNPNTLTMISLAFAILGGMLFLSAQPWALVLASIMVIMNSLLDAIDGKVARLTGKASKRGDFLDHLVDRYSDLAILVGITLGPWCHDWVGVLAIVGVFMTSYTGTQAQALGQGRNYGGILGRADRMVFLMLFPLFQAVFSFMGYGGYTMGIPAFPILTTPPTYTITIMEIMMIWFAIAGNITALQRAKKAWHYIGRGKKGA